MSQALAVEEKPQAEAVPEEEAAISFVTRLAPPFYSPWRWRQSRRDPDSWIHTVHRPNGHTVLQLGLLQSSTGRKDLMGFYEYRYRNSLPYGWHNWEVQLDMGPISIRPFPTNNEMWVFLQVRGPSYVRAAWHQPRSQEIITLRAGGYLRPGRYTIQVGGLVIINNPSDARQYREIIVDRVNYVNGPADTPKFSSTLETIAARTEADDFETLELTAPEGESAPAN